MNKYRNKKVIVDGEKFDSQREYKRFYELKILQHAGKISDLKRQVPFILLPSVVMGGKKEREIKYIADFTYLENGKLVVDDSKGVKTKEYKLKRRLMMFIHGVEIRET